MKLEITKTFCVLMSVAGLVLQPLFLIGNNISNQEPASTDSVTISRPIPRLGVYKPVTLLVDFSDRPANSLSTRAYYQDLFFSQMGNSVTTFLKANSLDKFDCQGVVYWNATDNGWIVNAHHKVYHRAHQIVYQSEQG